MNAQEHLQGLPRSCDRGRRLVCEQLLRRFFFLQSYLRAVEQQFLPPKVENYLLRKEKSNRTDWKQNNYAGDFQRLSLYIFGQSKNLGPRTSMIAS